MMSNLINKYIKYLNLEIDIIIAMPSSADRENERGGNHLLKLANNIRRIINIDRPSKIRMFNGLKAKNYTNLASNSGNRFILIKDKFYLNNKDIKYLKNKNILLIDDLITSGATMQEAVKTLNKAGTNLVLPVSISRTSF